MAKTSSQPDRADVSKIALTMRAFKEFSRGLMGGGTVNGVHK